MKLPSGYFLPYQTNWITDESPVKIWEKSRRIGATYAQSYEDVLDAVKGKTPAVWFSSADESAAREYILYAEKWARMYDAAARNLGQQVLDTDRDIKTYTIEFSNGVRINALSSNPKAFRSKGGKVILDEFAWHDDARKLWQAARPVITWGYPLRILSTHNGKNSLYNQFVESIRKGALKWSLHKTDIFQAVQDGLVDKILGRHASDTEKAAWIAEQRENCFDENTWQQEFCCIPVDETSAFLTYEMIASIERQDLYRSLKEIEGDLLVGMDIGRRKDLSVIWGLERLGHVKYTRFIKVMEKAPFSQQKEALFEILRHNKTRRCCIDATGLGMQLAEEAQTYFGKYRVEALNFTAKVKEELAYNLRTEVEDRTVYIPGEFQIREDLHSVRKVTTSAGNIRFDVAASESGQHSHADRFWALALALHAGQTASGPVYIASRLRRKVNQILQGF